MTDQTPSPEVREALEELQRYLADNIPPLVVADSVRLLLRYPAELIATSIHAWALGQRDTSVPLSDYLYHGARKIFLMGDFKLLPQEPFDEFMAGLKNSLLDFCPDADRGLLATSLVGLSVAANVPTTAARRVRPREPDRGVRRGQRQLRRAGRRTDQRGAVPRPSAHLAAARTPGGGSGRRRYLQIHEEGSDPGLAGAFRRRAALGVGRRARSASREAAQPRPRSLDPGHLPGPRPGDASLGGAGRRGDAETAAEAAQRPRNHAAARHPGGRPRRDRQALPGARAGRRRAPERGLTGARRGDARSGRAARL